MTNERTNLLRDNISSLEELQNRLNIDTDKLKPVVERHPMYITQYYFDLIDQSDDNDPIRKMCIPSNLELESGGDYDTSGEQDNTVLPGLQHKYRQTSLVLSTNICYMYCRHCFRKRLVGYTQDEIVDRMNEAVNYISKHKEIDNVLISGGDSFTLSNKVIRKYLESLSGIEHLDFIRFGTRVPVVLPMRISEDQELLNILKEYNKKKRIIIVTQFNHPKEINEHSIAAIEALRKINIDVYNQTVLLKDVNDNPDTLIKLIKNLIKNRITPYYVFQCRPVKHVKTHFQVPLSRGIEIIDQTRDRLNGISKQFRYAMSHPRGKIEILGKTDKNLVLFKFQQAKNKTDANNVFMREINNEHSWLDLDLNPIN